MIRDENERVTPSKTWSYCERRRMIPEHQVRRPEFSALISPTYELCNLDHFASPLWTSFFSPVKWGTWNHRSGGLPYRAVRKSQQDHNCKNALCSVEPYTNVCYYYYYCYYHYYYTVFFGQDIYVKLTQHIIGVLKLNKWSQLSDSFKINDVITT